MERRPTTIRDHIGVTFHSEPPLVRWPSEIVKACTYRYLYGGCDYPFDDPCDDCSHWMGRRSA